jgi:hypothetical protein
MITESATVVISAVAAHRSDLDAVMANAAPVNRCMVAESTPVEVSSAVDSGPTVETTANRTPAVRTARAQPSERRAASANSPMPTANAMSVVSKTRTMPTWVGVPIRGLTRKLTSAARPAAQIVVLAAVAATAPMAASRRSERLRVVSRYVEVMVDALPMVFSFDIDELPIGGTVCSS